MKSQRPRKVSYEEYEREASTKYGYVYLLTCQNTGFDKIGWTLKDPEERLEDIRKEFRNGFDWALEARMPCYNPPGVEKAFHRWLDGGRVTSKREWFVLDEQDRAAIKNVFHSAEEAHLAYTLAMQEKGQAYAQGRREGHNAAYGKAAEEFAERAYQRGYREGVAAGRHLQEIDHYDGDLWSALSEDEKFVLETEGVDNAAALWDRYRAADALIDRLKQRGVRLRVTDDGQRVNFRPSSLLTDEDRGAILCYKPQLLRLLEHEPIRHKSEVFDIMREVKERPVAEVATRRGSMPSLEAQR